MFKKEAVIIILVLIFCGGCSHTLEVKNLGSYESYNQKLCLEA